MQIQEVLQVQPIASSTSGYDGGTKSIRDTSGLTGGIRGHVNCVSYSYTIAGKNVKAFEWNNLSILDNYADEGENCASYIQANKFGIGPTWAACAEACSLDENDKSPLITYEMDSWVSGEDSGNRFTLDLVVGDSKVMRGKESSGKAEATAAIRIGANTSCPNAKYTKGIILGKAIDTGIDATEMQGEVVLKLNSKQVIQIGSTTISDQGVTSKNYVSYLALGLSLIALAICLL
jgi:hypothetical protein